jgi:hypothetical protein
MEHQRGNGQASNNLRGSLHAKILVGCLTLDRCLVEAAESMNDALLALALEGCEPLTWRETARLPEQGLDVPMCRPWRRS